MRFFFKILLFKAHSSQLWLFIKNEQKISVILRIHNNKKDFLSFFDNIKTKK